MVVAAAAASAAAEAAQRQRRRRRLLRGVSTNHKEVSMYHMCTAQVLCNLYLNPVRYRPLWRHT
jgi:hypothetical protein